MKITVKIGAALDGDLQKILYEPLAAGAARARQRVKSEMGATFNEVNAKAREALKVETATRLIEERRRAQESLAIAKGKMAQERALAQQQRAHELALDRDAARQRIREDEKATREGVRIRKEALREEAKARKESESMVRSFAGGVAGNARGIVSRGVGVAADIARGAGVSFDVASGVKKRTELESAATALANAGYQEGEQGIAGQRQDPRAIMADIQRAGETYGIAQADIAEALDKFVGKTGELQTGREMLDAFAKTAKATGASMEDIAAAAGAVSNKLGDVPDKANAINKVMLAIAGQGKVGAVEIKDLATQMEKLTSQASKFSTNADLKSVVGTDTGANIAMLGVLAQAARKTEKGSAAQATQSAMAFVRDLTSQTATKRIMTQNQIGLYSDKDRTQLRDPQEIIKDIISKTKGDQTKLSYMMSNQNSRAVVNAFMDPYLNAYKGTKGTAAEKDKAGRDAVDAAFQKLKVATLSDKAQQSAVDAAMASTATKVEQFQQKLDRVVGDMADQVIPALLKLAPTAIDAAKAMSNIATWATNNPMGAAGGVVAASMAKTMADTAAGALAKGIGAALAGSALLSGLTVASLVIGSVGMMAISEVLSEQKKGQKMADSEDAAALNAFAELRAAQREYEARDKNGPLSPEQETEARAKLEAASRKAGAVKYNIEQRMTEGIAVKEGNEGTSFTESIINSMFGTELGSGQNMSQREASVASAEKLDEMARQLDLLSKAMDGVGKTLGEGIAIKSLPAGAPALGGATTGPGG